MRSRKGRGWGLIITQVRRVVARLLGFKFIVKPKNSIKHCTFFVLENHK